MAKVVIGEAKKLKDGSKFDEGILRRQLDAIANNEKDNKAKSVSIETTLRDAEVAGAKIELACYGCKFIIDTIAKEYEEMFNLSAFVHLEMYAVYKGTLNALGYKEKRTNVKKRSLKHLEGLTLEDVVVGDYDFPYLAETKLTYKDLDIAIMGDCHKKKAVNLSAEELAYDTEVVERLESNKNRYVGVGGVTNLGVLIDTQTMEFRLLLGSNEEKACYKKVLEARGFKENMKLVRHI